MTTTYTLYLSMTHRGMDSIYKRSLKTGAEIAVQALAFNKIDQSAYLAN